MNEIATSILSTLEETDAPVFRGLHHECLEAILRKS